MFLNFKNFSERIHCIRVIKLFFVFFKKEISIAFSNIYFFFNDPKSNH